MTHLAAFPRLSMVAIAGFGLVVSLTSPLPDAGAAAAATSISAAPMAAISTAVAAATALTAASPADAAHPFSDPIWSPVRTPAEVSCVRTNCNNGTYHGYWAIDFLDTNHKTFEPLYAAGAGIFHIGAMLDKAKDKCGSPAGVGGSDTWVWIDHGGSRVTRYAHLNDVTAVEGQLVTPKTKIGTMGHSGNGPCNFNYLHMEYRAGGVGGPRVPIPAMLTCATGGRVSMPSSLGYAAWDLVPDRTVFTPAATNACLATSRGADTPNRPAVKGRRGPTSATLSWGAAAGVNHSLVTIERWSPSLRRYGRPVVSRKVAGAASSTRFSGLLRSRLYRFRVTQHNGAGYSAWSAYVKVTTAGR
jgi:Peptidase family M23